MQPDPMKTTEDDRRAIEKFNQNKQMIQSLEDLASMSNEIIQIFDSVKKDGSQSTKEMGALLADMRESLVALNDKEAPEQPDTAKPVVDALAKLEKALTASVKAIDVKPTVKVDAPQVNVDSPSVSVDLKGVEKLLKTDLPKAFKESMKLIPKPDKFDPKPLLAAYKELGKKLDDIDTGVRMKQAGVNARITNFSDMPDVTVDTTGLATSAKQDTIIGHIDGVEGLLTTIDADTGTIATEVAGLLTDTELRATPVPVSGTVTATPTGTQNVDVTANTIGLATSANQTNGNQIAVAKGDVASGSADSGNPVKVGAKYNSTQPTFTDGQRADMQVDSRGNLRMGLYANNTQTTASFKADNADADATSATANKLGVMSRGTVYNGTTWDRQLGDATNGTLVNLGANNDVTVTSGAITETNSAAIKTAVETIDNAISGSEMQVDVVGALPAGTNAIGKLAANSGVDIGDVDVTSSVSATLDHGSNLDIDTTAEQITTTSFAAKFGVTVKSAADNTDTVYIGNSDITAGTTAATDGFPLEPGESITLPVNNSNLLYAIGAAANQKVFWSAV